MEQATRLLREPLVHFFVLGAAIFLLSALVGDSDDPPRDEVVVTAGHVASMLDAFQRTWLRPPTAAELDGLIDDYIREEIFYREALALGLDRNDTIIRRRLRQKLEFLPQDVAEQVEPSDTELEQYLRRHADEFQVEARISFEQIFVNQQRRGGSAEDEATKLLASLRGSTTPLDPALLGDATLLPHDMESVGQSEVARTFGQEFAEGLADIEPGDWIGPIVSGFGLHLVRVLERTRARAPALDDVRGAVTREWHYERRQELDVQFYRGLREQYTVTVQLPDWLEPDQTQGLGRHRGDDR